MADPFDVIVIGSGFGGAWAARELAENGLKVKLFESGPRYDPDRDFTESVVEMYGFFGWKGRRVRVGQGVGNMSTGVGGSSLDYWAFSPQPQNFAIDEWDPVIRNDLFDTEVDPYTGYSKPIKFYAWIDRRVPIDLRQDRPVSCAAEKCIEAARALGYTAGRCPAAVLPSNFNRVDEKGIPLEGCVGCAHCVIGCRRPLHMPLHAKAKRTMQVAAVWFAEYYGTEVVPNAHVTRILTDGSGAACGVEYKLKGDPQTYTEEKEKRSVLHFTDNLEFSPALPGPNRSGWPVASITPIQSSPSGEIRFLPRITSGMGTWMNTSCMRPIRTSVLPAIAAWTA